MAWSTIRRATDADNERLDTAARRFCVRHGIDEHGERRPLDIEMELEYDRRDGHRRYPARLLSQWRRIVRRILDSPNAEGVAYGYVGFNVD